MKGAADSRAAPAAKALHRRKVEHCPQAVCAATPRPLQLALHRSALEHCPRAVCAATPRLSNRRAKGAAD